MTSARKAVAAEAEALLVAVDFYARQHGAAEWTNGYRAGGKDSEEMHREEMSAWGRVGQARADVQLALRRYTAAVRRGATTSSPRQRAVGKSKPGRS